MYHVKNLILACLLTCTMVQVGIAQCETWVDSPKKNKAEENHVLYRDRIKMEQFDEAYSYWKVAYDIAPAADGNRSTHYIDGRKIFMHKWKNTTDESKKEEYKNWVLRLYDEQIKCYNKEGFLLGRKAYDMYYSFNMSAKEVYDAARRSLEVSKNKSEYIILVPLAASIAKLFPEGEITQEEAQKVVSMMENVADYNIEHNKHYGKYYKQAKDGMEAQLAPVLYDIFDCEYFIEKLTPVYEADPDNRDVYKEVYQQMEKAGCVKEEVPMMMEIYKKETTYVEAQRFASDPGYAASKLYKEGDYTGAVKKYTEALNNLDDLDTEYDKDSLRATYYFAMASIQGRKLGKYSKARSNAYKAAEYRSGWGRPYMLIGDLYAKSANSCGKDAFEKQMVILAAIDKWAYARSIDSEVSEEASNKIANYSEHKPDHGEAHMRGVDEGDLYSVGCWIGEKVKVRF